MSKMDALRAMREAKYEANKARAAGPTAGRATPKAAPTAAPTAATTAATRPAPKKAAARAAGPAGPAEAPSEELCGHRNMSGRTCTRERGHAAKSHRYS